MPGRETGATPGAWGVVVRLVLRRLVALLGCAIARRPSSVQGRVLTLTLALQRVLGSRLDTQSGATAQARAASSFAPDSTADATDASPGDGNCATVDGTLRAAIQEANATPRPDSISLPAGTYELGIPPLNVDGIETGDLSLTDSLTIAGAGAAMYARSLIKDAAEQGLGAEQKFYSPEKAPDPTPELLVTISPCLPDRRIEG